MDGWLSAPPRWHLVADPATATEWEAPLREGLDQPVELVTPLPAPELAALTAKRAAHAESKANLLPAEFSTRYQQQFVDRLWMRGLLAVAAIYILGVIIYGIALGVATYRTRSVEKQVAALGPTYTNALQFRARYEVLKDRHELKFAGLDCWNATAKLMPESLTLEGMTFGDGRKLTLNGTAPSDQVSQLIEFSGAMRKYAKDGQPLFDPTKGEPLRYNANAGGNTVRWDFSLELKRVEAQ
jgi:hypothetical protein